jgi:hypothetical protein
LWGTTSAIVPSPALTKRRIPAKAVGWNSPRWRKLVRAAQVSGRFGAVVLAGEQTPEKHGHRALRSAGLFAQFISGFNQAIIISS